MAEKLLNCARSILKEVERFYQALYMSNNSSFSKRFRWRPLFQQGNQCTISDDERRLWEGLLTAREFEES